MGNQGDVPSNDGNVPRVPDAAAIGDGQPAGRQEEARPVPRRALVNFNETSSEDEPPDDAIGPRNAPPPPAGGGAPPRGRDESRRRGRRFSGNTSSKKRRPK
jgi:hypothetical protein